MAGDNSDVDLMMRVKRGDREAFNSLVERYRKSLINFIFRFTCNEAASEDLAHEVFLKVFKSAERYEPKAEFSTWLYRIASNSALNFLRDQRNRALVPIGGDSEDGEEAPRIDLADRQALVEEQLIEQERVRTIRKAVASLPDQQRLALVLTKYQGLSLRQTAAVLKSSEPAVKSLIFRAYSTLREKLVSVVSI